MADLKEIISEKAVGPIVRTAPPYFGLAPKISTPGSDFHHHGKEIFTR
jgi:hypothetical protein